MCQWEASSSPWVKWSRENTLRWWKDVQFDASTSQEHTFYHCSAFKSYSAQYNTHQLPDTQHYISHYCVRDSTNLWTVPWGAGRGTLVRRKCPGRRSPLHTVSLHTPLLNQTMKAQNRYSGAFEPVWGSAGAPDNQHIIPHSCCSKALTVNAPRQQFNM